MNGEGLDLTPQEIEEIKKRRAMIREAETLEKMDSGIMPNPLGPVPPPVQALPDRCCGKCRHGVEVRKEFVCAAMPPVTMVVQKVGPQGLYDDIVSTLTFTKRDWPACARFDRGKPVVHQVEVME